MLDDLPARRLATALGLPVVGTLGILVAAKQRGLISQIQLLLDELVQHGFFIAPGLYRNVLSQVGESLKSS